MMPVEETQIWEGACSDGKNDPEEENYRVNRVKRRYEKKKTFAPTNHVIRSGGIFVYAIVLRSMTSLV